MLRKRRLLVLPAVLVALCGLFAGCGQSTASEEADWITALGVVLGGFAKEQQQDQAAIANATTAAQLHTAYMTYEHALEGEIAKLEAINPPPPCDDLHHSMVAFAKKSLSLTQRLTAGVSREEIGALRAEGEAMKAHFEQEIASYVNRKHC